MGNHYHRLFGLSAVDGKGCPSTPKRWCWPGCSVPLLFLAIAHRLNILAALASKTESRIVLPVNSARRGNRELNYLCTPTTNSLVEVSCEPLRWPALPRPLCCPPTC